FLRLALELDVLRAQPGGALVYLAARVRLEREVVQADAIAVVRLGFGQRLAQAERAARAAQIPDRLPALALHLGDGVEAERAEQLGVEGQAALDRGDDEIDVMDAR